MEYINKDEVLFQYNTKPEVIDLILSLIKSRKKVSITYGDPISGKDWFHERIKGCIFVSNHKSPIIVGINTTTRGNRVWTGNILRIHCKNEILYQHPNFHQGEIRFYQFESGNCTVVIDGEIHKNFISVSEMNKWIKKMKIKSYTIIEEKDESCLANQK